MRGEGLYDLVVLEPPPIAQAGVGALYSREFYALARGRLSPKGYISQWLPAYQVPADTTLAMIRAFVDVFPQAVLLCGANQELLLVGTNDSRIEIDPNRLAKALADAPAVQSDLRRVGLGTMTEIVGTFVGGARTLHEATRSQPPVTDDRPIQEYGAKSRLSLGYQLLPASDLRSRPGRRVVPAVLRRREAGAAGERARSLPREPRRVYEKTLRPGPPQTP